MQDSVAGHRRTLEALQRFLLSDDHSVELTPSGACSRCPDWEPLRALRMVKTTGLLRTRAHDGILQVSGRPELVSRYADYFDFEPGAGGHLHPEQSFGGELDPASEAIIIEVDDDCGS